MDPVFIEEDVDEWNPWDISDRVEEMDEWNPSDIDCIVKEEEMDEWKPSDIDCIVKEEEMDEWNPWDISDCVVKEEMDEWNPWDIYDKKAKENKLNDYNGCTRGTIKQSKRNAESSSHSNNNSWRNFETRATRQENFRQAFRCRKMYETREFNNACDFIQIDSHFVGKVIGRGGAKIQEIERLSEANVKVLPNSDDGGGKTTIKIYGSASSLDKARQLIEELTIDNRTHIPIIYQSTTPDHPKKEDSPPIDWQALYRRSEEERKKREAARPKIIKDFYDEDPAVKYMRPEEVEEFRKMKNNISVCKINCTDDRAIPNPIITFEQAFQKYPELIDEIKKQNFTTPSPIQCQAWPIILKGYDLIGIAQTGTGKTIAFLFPALIHIVNQLVPREERVGPTCLILAPTRELALQIEEETKKYQYHDIKCVCLYGGGSRKSQIDIVTKGVDIVIATPGRLNDLILNKIVDVSGVTYLVLDEADRMLDMGFQPQISKILIDIRNDRQTIMTSATWTNQVQEMAQKYMTDPIKVNVGSFDLAAVHSVKQELIFANDDDRKEILIEFLKNMDSEDKVIVFVDRKSVADDVSSDLILKGIECQSIHGDREQYDREQALDDIKTGFVRILIATDVASRGLDIKDITYIFNMYFPRNIEEYVHRVGRTGRAGRTGTAITIITRNDWMHAERLIKILEEANQDIPQELIDMADRYRSWKAKKDAEDAAVGGRRRFQGGRHFNRF